MKKILVMLIFIISLSCSCIYATGRIPQINNIGFDIYVNNDGSVNVEENWHLAETNSGVIKINEQLKEAGNITDLKVYRKSGGEIIEFVPTDYDVEQIKTGNYSVQGSGDEHTILCGVGRYKDFTVSYKVNDVAVLYADCADIQLNLVDKSLGIDVNSIKANVYYPTKASKPGVISAWEKHANLKSEIKEKDTEKLYLEAYNVDSSGVSIRVVMPNTMFGEVKNVSSKMMLEEIKTKETNEAQSSAAKNTFITAAISISVVFGLFIMIKNTFKYIKESGKVFGAKPTKKIKYSRELPFNNITPGQATFIKDSGNIKMGDIFAATLLSMKIKGVIDITYTGEKNKLESTYIKILDIKPDLTVEEQPVFDFLIDCLEKFQKADLMISLNMLQKYISHSSGIVAKLKKDMLNEIKKSIPSYNEQADKKIKKRKFGIFIYSIILITMIILPTKWFDVEALRVWTILVAITNIIFCISIAVKTRIFDQTGIDHNEQLKALENYMLEFSKFKQKGVPEISIWEYYIIFAMSFGISKQVLEQINSCYPNIEDTTFMESYVIAKNLDKCYFKRSFMMVV